MNIKLIWILVTILSVSYLNGCSDMTSAKPAAEAAVAKFHQQYNSEDFLSIFNDSHKDFKGSENLARFREFMQAVYSKLGKVKSTENANWKVGNFNLKTTASMQQKTEFENGSGFEAFSFVIKDEKAILVGYNINSRELIIK